MALFAAYKSIGIEGFRYISAKFAKINPRKIFNFLIFAKIKPREISDIFRFAKIKPREMRKTSFAKIKPREN